MVGGMNNFTSSTMAVSEGKSVLAVPAETSDHESDQEKLDIDQIVEGYKIGLCQRFSIDAKEMAISKGDDLSELVSRTRAAMLAVERGLKMADKRQFHHYNPADSVLFTHLENALDDLIDSDEYMIMQGYIMEAKPELLLRRNIAIDEINRGICAIEREIDIGCNVDFRLLEQLKVAANELRDESDEDIQEFMLHQNFQLVHYAY
ncbi:unnamed protein product [Orchesella dallaii]|uniref:Uncharacterized protein n=1 Tax=Orchesella dallaii TaxID=48710 RepID=A0ABP1PSX9_9HEXA